jgi:MFS family permease
MMLTLASPLMIAEWHLTLGQAGLLGTAGMVGVGLSALVLGWYADRYGRRPALLASVVIFALFTAAIALARNRWEVMALRFIAGFGIGGVWGRAHDTHQRGHAPGAARPSDLLGSECVAGGCQRSGVAVRGSVAAARMASVVPVRRGRLAWRGLRLPSRT